MKLANRLAFGLALCGLFGAVPLTSRALEKVPHEIVRALGTTRGKLVSTGLVFIDGKYLKPPYRVIRSGNQILVNDRPVTGQIVPWEKFLETQPSTKLKVTEVEDGDAPPEKSDAPAEDGVDPAAPKDGGNAPAADGGSAKLVVTIEETRLGANADDLEDFDLKNMPEKMKLSDIPADSEADKARQKRAEDEKREAEKEEAEEEEKKDEPSDGTAEKQDDEEIDPASPEGEAAAKAAAAKQPKPAPVAKKTRKVTTLEGAFEMNFRGQKLMKPIEDRRAGMEKVLRRGGFLFIGTGARPYLKGAMSDAVWTKELLKKLPELMSKAKDAESFCDEVRSAGLFSYLNMQIAKDLYRHKRAYYELMQRRKAIAEEEKLTKMTR